MVMRWYRRRVERRTAERISRWMIPIIQELVTSANEWRDDPYSADAADQLEARAALMISILKDIEVQLVGRELTIWLGLDPRLDPSFSQPAGKPTPSSTPFFCVDPRK